MKNIFSSLKQSLRSLISNIPHVSAQEAYSLTQQNQAILMDVRESNEVEGGLAAPALWIATSEYENCSTQWKEFVERLRKDKQVILYCAVGGRAGRIAEALANQGFQTANMGGYRDWLKAGLPTNSLATKN